MTCWNLTNCCLCCQQFVYINSAFSPNPDELVIDLYNVRFLPKMYLHQFFLNLYSKIDVSAYFFLYHFVTTSNSSWVSFSSLFSYMFKDWCISEQLNHMSFHLETLATIESWYYAFLPTCLSEQLDHVSFHLETLMTIESWHYAFLPARLMPITITEWFHDFG